MEKLELLEHKVRLYMAKKQARHERLKRHKAEGRENYSEFKHGEVWGNVRACQVILGMLHELSHTKEVDGNKWEEVL